MILGNKQNEMLMLNGVRGSLKQTDFEWCCWDKNDLISFTIDLQQKEKMNTFTIGCITNYGMGVHKPKSIRIAVSDDNKSYRDVTGLNYTPEEIFREGTYIEDLSMDMKGTEARYHVLPAPIVPLRLAVSFSQAVFPEAVIIRERHTRCGIGIEIIVHMDSVHVVTADDITHYPADKLTAFRQSRVEKDLFIIGDKPFGILMIDVGIGETGVSRRARPVRIQPSVKLHVPFMAFLDQEGHRVELTCRGYALLSGEEAAPRLDIGFIESVRLGAHLKDDGVDAACLQVIKLADEVFFHPGGSHILVFALKSGLYPCSPKLSLGLLARTRSRTRLLANRRT